jgi:hypothetical protein
MKLQAQKTPQMAGSSLLKFFSGYRLLTLVVLAFTFPPLPRTVVVVRVAW